MDGSFWSLHIRRYEICCNLWELSVFFVCGTLYDLGNRERSYSHCQSWRLNLLIPGRVQFRPTLLLVKFSPGSLLQSSWGLEGTKFSIYLINNINDTFFNKFHRSDLLTLIYHLFTHIICMFFLRSLRLFFCTSHLVEGSHCMYALQCIHKIYSTWFWMVGRSLNRAWNGSQLFVVQGVDDGIKSPNNGRSFEFEEM